MGILAAAVGANVADGDPDEPRHRLGSPLPAAKSADRVLNSSDAGSELRAPAGGRRDKRLAFPILEVERDGRKQGADRGKRPGSVHELSCQAEGLTGDDRGNGPIGSICPPQQGHRSHALSGSR
jgi:hypothetical protein